VEAFQNHLRATQRAGLMNAVNMDTGYVNFLSEAEKLEVLDGRGKRWARARSLWRGVHRGQDGEIVSLYRKQMDAIVAHGGIPILFQTKRLPWENFSREGVGISRGESRVFACAGI